MPDKKDEESWNTGMMAIILRRAISTTRQPC